MAKRSLFALSRFVSTTAPTRLTSVLRPSISLFHPTIVSKHKSNSSIYSFFLSRNHVSFGQRRLFSLAKSGGTDNDEDEKLQEEKVSFFFFKKNLQDI